MSHAGQITRVWATINTMMRDRGGDAALSVSAVMNAGEGDAATATATATSMPTFALSGEDVVAMSAGRSVFHVDLPGGTTFHRVIFDLLPRFKVVDIRKVLQEAKQHPPSAPFKRAIVILVIIDTPNAAIMKGITTAAAATMPQPPTPSLSSPTSTTPMDLEVQVFAIKELLVDVSKHMWVPQHEPIRDEKTIIQILRKYKVTTRYNFPLIMTTDRMARHLALRHGELVRITRTSPSAGMYTLYRCCMRAS